MAKIKINCKHCGSKYSATMNKNVKTDFLICKHCKKECLFIKEKENEYFLI